jgi:hypothetical protein
MSRAIPAVLMLLLWFAAPLCAQTGTRILHLKVTGAIDCRKMAEDLEMELQKAAAKGVGLVLLELEGSTARMDVVWTMAQRLKACGLPSAAVLGSPPGATAGLGQTVLAVLANRSFITRQTRIVGGSADQRLAAAAAPAETQWGRIEEELTAALGSRLRERGGSEALAGALVSPTVPMWLVEDASGARVVTEPPDPAAGAAPIATRRGEEVAVVIAAPDAIRLKIAEEFASGTGMVLSTLGYRNAGRETVTISSGLSRARERVLRELESTAVELERVKSELNVKQKHDRTITDRDYRDAGRDALMRIERVERALQDLGRTLGEYPELELFPRPPGSRATRPPKDSVPGRLTDLREDLQKLKTTAQEYATRP